MAPVEADACRAQPVGAVLLYMLIVVAAPIATRSQETAVPTIPALAKFSMFKYTPPEQLLPLTFHGQAMQLLAERKAGVAKVITRAEWRTRQASVLSTLRNETFAPINLPKTPLNPVVTKRTKDPRGFEVINIIFESRPKFYVTGSLFLPSNRSTASRLPGVVFSNGHWCLDHRDVASARQQNVILNTVMLGIAVFAYDSIGQGERTQYLDPATNRSRVGGCTFNPDTCEPIGIAHNEENYIGRQAWLTDVTTPSLWLWDSIRAVDLLASRPEVDSGKLGAMGCSGGGTQTAFLASVDERIGPAVVACYSSTFEREWQHSGPSTQYQHFAGGFASGLDKQDLYQARAPKPTLQLVTTDDPAFPLQGARDMLSSSFPAFHALGNGAALEGHEAIFAHGWVTPNNEAMYRFFARTFQLSAHVNTTERAFEPLPCRVLTVTTTGRVMDSLPGMQTAHGLLLEALTRLTAALTKARGSPGFLTRLPTTAARVSGMVTSTQAALGSPWAMGSMYARGQRGDASGVDTERCATERDFTQNCTVGDIEKWVVPSEGVCVSVVWVRRPANLSDTSSVPAVVLLSAGAESSNGTALSNAIWAQMVGHGHSVALVVASLCGLGETGPENRAENDSRTSPRLGGDSGESTQGMPRFLGRSTVGFHAGEIQRVLKFVESRGDISGVAAVVAADHTGPAALHALATFVPEMGSRLDRGASNVALAVVGSVSDYASVVKAEYYATPSVIDITGVLAHYDLPDLSAALAPRPQLLLGPVDPMLQPLPASQATAAFSVAQTEYARQGHAANFRVETCNTSNPFSVAHGVGAWLLSTMRAR